MVIFVGSFCIRKSFWVSFYPIQQIHTYLTNTLGIPSWGSYVIFAIVTLFLGLLLGLVSKKKKLPKSSLVKE